MRGTPSARELAARLGSHRGRRERRVNCPSCGQTVASLVARTEIVRGRGVETSGAFDGARSLYGLHGVAREWAAPLSFRLVALSGTEKQARRKQKEKIKWI